MLIPIDPSRPIVDADGKVTQQFQTFLLLLASDSLVIGTGSPEGVIEANQRKMYMDDTGLTGAVLYIKQLADIGGNRRLGWILV